MQSFVLGSWSYFLGFGLMCLGIYKYWEHVLTLNELMLSFFVVLLGFVAVVFFGTKSDEFAGVKYFLGLITPVIFGAVLLIFLT